MKQTSIRTILSVVVQAKHGIDSNERENDFLHGDLQEVIHMKQPDGFELGGEDKMCLLKKSLYGLRQSPRQ